MRAWLGEARSCAGREHRVSFSGRKCSTTVCGGYGARSGRVRACVLEAVDDARVGWRSEGSRRGLCECWRVDGHRRSLAVHGEDKGAGWHGRISLQFLSRTARGEAVASWRSPGQGGTAGALLWSVAVEEGEKRGARALFAIDAVVAAGDKGTPVFAPGREREVAGDTGGGQGWLLTVVRSAVTAATSSGAGQVLDEMAARNLHLNF